MQFLIFKADARMFALELSIIEKVVWAASLIPLSKEEPKKCGLINIYGRIMPVISMRNLLHFPLKEMELSDQFIVCHNQEDWLCLWVDKVLEVKEYGAAELLPAENIFSNSLHVHHIIKDKNEIFFVWDIQKLFESAEALGVNEKAKV